MPGWPYKDRDAAGEHSVCQAPAGSRLSRRHQAECAALHHSQHVIVGHLQGTCTISSLIQGLMKTARQQRDLHSTVASCLLSLPLLHASAQSLASQSLLPLTSTGKAGGTPCNEWVPYFQGSKQDGHRQDSRWHPGEQGGLPCQRQWCSAHVHAGPPLTGLRSPCAAACAARRLLCSRPCPSFQHTGPGRIC